MPASVSPNDSRSIAGPLSALDTPRRARAGSRPTSARTDRLPQRKSACVPRSTSRPPSSTRMASAFTTVDSRCAIMRTVLPRRRAPQARCWMSTSFSGSAYAVASSNTTIGRVLQDGARQAPRAGIRLAGKVNRRFAPNDGVQPVRQLRHYVVALGGVRGGLHLGAGRIGPCGPDVVGKALLEQPLVLEDERHALHQTLPSGMSRTSTSPMRTAPSAHVPEARHQARRPSSCRRREGPTKRHGRAVRSTRKRHARESTSCAASRIAETSHGRSRWNSPAARVARVRHPPPSIGSVHRGCRSMRETASCASVMRLARHTSPWSSSWW